MSPKRKPWRSRLSKKQLRHLREDAGVTTLAALKRNCEGQARMRREHEGWEPCWECKSIARTMGLEV